MQFKEWLARKTYYHGSFDKLPIGTILRPEPGYEEKWGGNAFYHVLEQFRPPNMISHKNAVFMLDNTDDLDNAGCADKYVYAVQPLGPVQKHDMNWSTEIDVLTSDIDIMTFNQAEQTKALKKVAMHYWRGDPHYSEPVWEYLTTYAVIVELVEEN